MRRMMTRLIAGIVLMALLASPALRAEPADDAAPLRMGVLPFMQTTLIFKRFGPLRTLLSERLGRPVRLETAPSFEEFDRRSAEQHYDILWTAPHFALRVADSGTYRVLATWTEPVVGVVAVRADSPLTSLRELAGRVVATPPEPAMVNITARAHLAWLGLRGDRAPIYRPQSGHLTSRFMLLSNKADAAIFVRQALEEAQRKGLPLRLLGEIPGVPGVAVLASPKLAPNLQDRIRRVFVELTDSEQGQAALAATELPSYRAAGMEDLTPVRPYLTAPAPTDTTSIRR